MENKAQKETELNQEELNQEDLEKADGGVVTCVYRKGRLYHVGPVNTTSAPVETEENKEDKSGGATGEW